MIPLSSKDAIRYPIKETDRVYLLKPPTFGEQANFKSDLRLDGAILHIDSAMLDAVRYGIRRHIDTSQQEACLQSVIDFQYENTQALQEQRPVDEDLADAVQQIEDFLLSEAPRSRYARMMAQREKWLDLAPLYAFKRFVIGWEGLDVEPLRVNGLLDEDCIRDLPPHDVSEVGWKCVNLMNTGSAERKNSESQSPSPETPARSTAGKKRPTAVPAGK